MVFCHSCSVGLGGYLVGFGLGFCVGFFFLLVFEQRFLSALQVCVLGSTTCHLFLNFQRMVNHTKQNITPPMT